MQVDHFIHLQVDLSPAVRAVCYVEEETRADGKSVVRARPPAAADMAGVIKMQPIIFHPLPRRYHTEVAARKLTSFNVSITI